MEADAERSPFLTVIKNIPSGGDSQIFKYPAPFCFCEYRVIIRFRKIINYMLGRVVGRRKLVLEVRVEGRADDTHGFINKNRARRAAFDRPHITG